MFRIDFYLFPNDVFSPRCINMPSRKRAAPGQAASHGCRLLGRPVLPSRPGQVSSSPPSHSYPHPELADGCFPLWT